MQIPVALGESNGGEIFWMYVSSNMAIYAIEMTRLEINGNLITLQPMSSQLFSEKDDFIMKYEVDQSSINSQSSIIVLREMWMWPTIPQQTLCSKQK